MRRLILAALAISLALPVSLWARYHERRIRRLGRRLSPQELRDAAALGVGSPEHLRVLSVEKVPNPVARICTMIERLTRFEFFEPAGLTLRYGIFVRADAATDRALLAHEFVHTVQYERSRGICRFLARYLFQCLLDGYEAAAWEQEAREVSARLLGQD